jgi:dihydroorotase
MSRILIRNALLVNEGKTLPRDVLVNKDRIERIDTAIAAAANDRVIDAEGLHLLPGMIDDQVHFREPGLMHKGDIATESAAAVAGGITSFMEMPNVDPLTVTLAELEQKYRRAANRAHANYAFYLGATNTNIDQVRALKPGQACGVKAFMGASTGDMLLDDSAALELLFADSPILIATHCEDTPTIKANEAKARAQYGEDVPMVEHPNIRSVEACYKSSSYAVDLAKKHDSRLHVLHITSAKELGLFAAGPETDKRITAEACVHHLYLDDESYSSLGTQIKCNPAIKSASDRKALLKALVSGNIDVIATDHAPHTLEEKNATYFKAPAGLPLVQHALQLMLEHVHDKRFGIELLAHKTSHAVANIFGVKERGYIREGYFADLVLVDMQRVTEVSREQIMYKCGWSPFEGGAVSLQHRCNHGQRRYCLAQWQAVRSRWGAAPGVCRPAELTPLPRPLRPLFLVISSALAPRISENCANSVALLSAGFR